MKNKLRVACSPLTHSIFAGNTLTEGTWASGKQDVTDQAVSAVAEHLLMSDTYMEFSAEGKRYKIHVSEIKNQPNEQQA